MIALWFVLACGPHRGPIFDVDVPEQVTERPTIGAYALLAEAAGDEDPGRRAQALAALVEADLRPGGGPWGARGLFDPDPWVQRATAQALIARGDAGSLAAVAGYVARPDVEPFERGLAGVALLRAGGALPDGVARAYQGERRAYRVAPLALLGAKAGEPGAIEALAEALGTGEMGMDLRLIEEVGRSGLTALIPSLRAAGESAEPELAAAFAVARLALGDRSARGTVRRALRGPEGPARDIAALLSTILDSGEALDEEALRGALGAGSRARDPVARFHAGLALAAENPTGRVLAGLAHRDGRVRALATSALGALPRGLAHERLGAALRDEDASVRRAALAVAAEIGFGPQRTTGEALLADDFLDVRLDAARALLLAPR